MDAPQIDSDAVGSTARMPVGLRSEMVGGGDVGAPLVKLRSP